MAGFSFSNIGGTTPVIAELPIGETVYEGQIVQSGLVGGAGGAVQVADAATEAHENDHAIMGIVLGVVDDSRSYSSTYYGNSSTYTTSQATVGSTGEPKVQVGLITPDTWIRGPIFNAAYGTALTECTVTSADSGGTTITHANDTITDIADDFALAYCRTGANRGEYRIVTTGGANEYVVTVPFPNTIAVGDVFVVASVTYGLGGLDIPASANCIDGNNDLNYYYDVIYLSVDLSESGKEYAVFKFCPKALGPLAA